MRSPTARIFVLALLSATLPLAVLTAQVKVLDKTTGQWKEVPQTIKSVGDNSAIIWLFQPGNDNPKAIAAVELKGSLQFESTGIVSGVDGLVDLRLFDPPSYDPKMPGRWQKIIKAELVQGRAIVTLEDGRIFTIYGLNSSISAIIVPGRTIPEASKPVAK